MIWGYQVTTIFGNPAYQSISYKKGSYFSRLLLKLLQATIGALCPVGLPPFLQGQRNGCPPRGCPGTGSLGSMVRINGLFHLLINGKHLGYKL